MSRPVATTPIRCTATVAAIGATTILRLPEVASLQLPSRGQVAVRASVDGAPLDTVLEPDGRKGHWLRLDPPAGKGIGDDVELTLEVRADWPEPEVPPDLAAALTSAAPGVRHAWNDITPMARWEWVRWVNATANAATRARRVEVTVSKLDDGKRRPCCFNLAACTDPELGRSGRLRTPTAPEE